MLSKNTPIKKEKESLTVRGITDLMRITNEDHIIVKAGVTIVDIVPMGIIDHLENGRVILVTTTAVEVVITTIVEVIMTIIVQIMRGDTIIVLPERTTKNVLEFT